MHSSTMLVTRIFTIHTDTSTKDSVLSHFLTRVSNLHLSGFKIVGWQIGCEFLNTWWTIFLILEYNIVLFFHFFLCLVVGMAVTLVLMLFSPWRFLAPQGSCHPIMQLIQSPIDQWYDSVVCSIVVLYLDIRQNLRWFQDICNFTFSNLQKVLQSMPHFPTSKILRINHQLARTKNPHQPKS